jgi:hypothetical protein
MTADVGSDPGYREPDCADVQGATQRVKERVLRFTKFGSKVSIHAKHRHMRGYEGDPHI